MHNFGLFKFKATLIVWTKILTPTNQYQWVLYPQENTNLKDENLSLNRENQHIRQELAGRSPQRYRTGFLPNLQIILSYTASYINIRESVALKRNYSKVSETLSIWIPFLSAKIIIFYGSYFFHTSIFPMINDSESVFLTGILREF